MKKLILLPIIMICLGLTVVNAQPSVKVRNGLIYMDDGTLSPNQKSYQSLTDSLDRNLKLNANDTTSLFYRSVLLLRYNSMIAKPAQTDQSAFDNLLLAIKMVDRADSLHAKSFIFKILQAEIHKEICYRFQGDQSWKYNVTQAASRRKKFNFYKELTNKYYRQLSLLDSKNAYTYEKLKVTSNYPIR